MNQKVMLGNEGIARGLIEAGVDMVTGYPGTPSSEIIPGVIAWKKQLGLARMPSDTSAFEGTPAPSATA